MIFYLMYFCPDAKTKYVTPFHIFSFVVLNRFC